MQTEVRFGNVRLYRLAHEPSQSKSPGHARKEAVGALVHALIQSVELKQNSAFDSTGIARLTTSGKLLRNFRFDRMDDLF